jgi:hypothetical protein
MAKSRKGMSFRIVSNPRRGRSPVKVAMDKVTRPSTFRSRKRSLEAEEAEKEINDYMEGIE